MNVVTWTNTAMKELNPKCLSCSRRPEHNQYHLGLQTVFGKNDTEGPSENVLVKSIFFII